MSASYLDISVRIEYIDFKTPKTFLIALHNEECLKLNSSFVFLERCREYYFKWYQVIWYGVINLDLNIYFASTK